MAQRLDELAAQSVAVNHAAAAGRAKTTQGHPGQPLRLCLALSGGLDSVALLHLLRNWCERRLTSQPIEWRAIHVDHQLRPASAEWARHCRRVAREAGITCTVVKVTVPKRRGESLEAAAREARYAALMSRLRPREWLVTAHHLDDQLETFLLQLMRGAGVAGLAGMPAWSAAPLPLWRPLLDVSRATLASWSQAQGLSWVEDDSNLDERFDRNFLRHRIVPLLQTRWPSAAKTAARSASHLGEARELLQALAEVDLAQVVTNGVVEIARLQMLEPARQRNLLRHWLSTQGLTTPDTVHLERIRSELPAAREDAQPLVRWEGGEVRRFQQRLYALSRALSPQASEAAKLASAKSTNAKSANGGVARVWRWNRQAVLELGEGLGRLRLVKDSSGQLSAARLPAQLRVTLRVGGERLRLRLGGPHHTVKELLRERGMPPWERARVPLVYAGDELVAVGDLFIAPTFCDELERVGSAKARAGLKALATESSPKRLRLIWER